MTLAVCRNLFSKEGTIEAIVAKCIRKNSSKRKRAGVEDFTYQPIFNSNKMKKVIMWKIDKNETTSRATPTPEREKQLRVNPEVQPPLPLGPPPPDKPSNMNFTLKKEIEDIQEYSSPGEESSDAINPSELTGYKSNESEDTDKSKIMCRDFIRGKCMRPGTCKFRHKCDISQLDGIFTFCRNFQNSVCARPNCKYVHATVFEEQHFYRTGELPPHALAHHKLVNILPPPPPPPPEEAPPAMPPMFKHTSPPPLPPMRMEKPPPAISCISASKMASTSVSVANMPLKRDWGNLESFRNLQQGMQHEAGRLPKRCRNCEYMELRLAFIKDKYEKTRKAKLETHQKLELLTKKRERLFTTLMSLPTFDAGELAGTSLSTTPSASGERQKWLLEQLNGTANANLITGIQEEANRNNVNGNLRNIVAKLLSIYRQNILTDASRRS